MTPIQETMNAVSMMTPCLILSQNSSENIGKQLLLLGTLAHLPISVIYHTGAALKLYEDRIDNDMRRIDQSMQHIISTLFSFALSKSISYTIMNGIVNIFFITKIWAVKTSNDGKRWVPVGFSMFAYTLPILLRCEIKNYAIATISICIGGAAAFIPTINFRLLYGWGHTIFHFMLGIFAYALSESASKLW
jgi:hypothetical protein